MKNKFSVKNLSILAFSLSTLFIGLTSQAQSKLEYDILFHGISVGKLTTEKQTRNQTTSYKLVSDAKFHVFLSYTVHFELSARFKNNILNLSRVKNIVNGNEKNSIRIVKNSEQEYIFSSKKIQHKLNLKHPEQKFDFSVAKLYFEEPKNREYIFSEKNGMFLKVHKTDQHSYKLKLPDHTSSVYHFNEKGICEMVEMNRGISSFKLKLINEID